jgi:hypothetical protein
MIDAALRAKIEGAIDRLVAVLDAMDAADEDREPSLAAPENDPTRRSLLLCAGNWSSTALNYRRNSGLQSIGTTVDSPRSLYFPLKQGNRSPRRVRS